MALGVEVGLGPIHIVLDGDIAPLPKKGAEPPQLSAQLFCGQTAGWMKTPLGTAVDLGPGHIVLDGVPASSREKGTAAPPPLFGPCVLWPRWPISATSELLFTNCRPKIITVALSCVYCNRNCTRSFD